VAKQGDRIGERAGRRESERGRRGADRKKAMAAGKVERRHALPRWGQRLAGVRPGAGGER
jgi:hypothetical protein